MDCITSIAELGTQGTFITTSWDLSMRLWSVEEQRCIRTFTDYTEELCDNAVMDSTTVMTLSGDTLKVVQVTNGAILAESDPFPHPLWCCASLSLTTAVVGDDDGNMYKIQWDGDVINVIERCVNAHNLPIKRMFKFAHKFATCSWDRTVKLWDATSLSRIRTFRGHADRVNCVAFDDAYLVSGSRDRTIRVYDVRTARHHATIRSHTNSVEFIQIVPGAQIIISSGTDNCVALHELPTGRCIAKYDIGVPITCGALLSTGLLAVAGYGDVCLFDVHRLRIGYGTSVADELKTVRREAAAWWSKYAALLERQIHFMERKHEAQITTAMGRIAILESKLEQVAETATERIAELENSLKRLSVAQDGDIDRCCVCLEPYRSGDNVFRLPCLHVHHAECLIPSMKLQREPKCPVCRTAVDEDDLDHLSMWKWTPPGSTAS